MPNIWASLNVPFIHFLLQFFPNSNVGQPPSITSSNLSGNINFPSLLSGTGGITGSQPATTTHLELFYRYPISKNISITPGVVFVFSPGNTASSDTITIGALRTTFTF
jgi:hypothetical protein